MTDIKKYQFSSDTENEQRKYINVDSKQKITKTKKVYKPRMSKKALEMLQKQKNLAQTQHLIATLCKVPSCDYKYFIRGDLLVDFDFLCDQVPYKQSFFSLNDFKPVKNVKFNKNDNFYEIHFDQGQEQIQNFNFIINMMNSVSNSEIHQLALVLENYSKALQILDRIREERMLALQSDIILEEDQYWDFNSSLSKANLILKEKLLNSEVFFYIITKGHRDYSELGIYGINQSSLIMILGNLDHDSTVKILLQNGLILMNQSFMDVLQNKLQEIQANINEFTEPDFLTFQQKVSNITINNHKLDINFTYEKYKLSNYSDKFNDNLILAKIDEKEKINLMNQLFVQKLVSDTTISEEKVLLSDITYQAQSEYFMDKFYTEKQTNNQDVFY